MVIERAERSMVKGMGKERSKEEEEEGFSVEKPKFFRSLSPAWFPYGYKTILQDA